VSDGQDDSAEVVAITRTLTGLGGISGLTKLPNSSFDFGTVGMITADTPADYRQANRRIASVAACELAAAAETAERDRKNAAVVVNALRAPRTRPVSKTTGT
jgi:hypothetical protein